MKTITRPESGAAVSNPEFESIGSVIRRVLAESDLNDPREIAEVVSSRVPPERMRDVLTTLLVAHISNMMGTQRNQALDEMFEQEPELEATLSGVTAKQQFRTSPKVAGIRDWWTKTLAVRVHVEDGWKTLGDCTESDLKFAEDERRTHAERELKRADMFLALRKLLNSYSVDTVSELHPSVVKGLVA